MENSDTGDKLAVEESKNEQPVEPVTSEAEDNSEPSHSDDDKFELTIDSEGEPEKQPEKKQPDLEMARKAFKEREAKRKQKEAEEKQKQEMIERLERLESEKAQRERGKPPTLADCDYDEELFQKRVSEYYSKSPSANASAKDAGEKQEQSRKVDPNIEIEAEKHERDISAKLPEYESIKTDLAMKFANDGVNPDAVISDIRAICHYAGVDSAKAIVGLEKVPGAYEQLKQKVGNDIAVSRFLNEVAGKVSLAKASKVDTVPEPNVNSGGTIDNTAATINKLYERWQESGSIQDYKALQDARKKLKGK